MPCNNQLDSNYNAKQARNDLNEAIAKAAEENRKRRREFEQLRYHR